MKKKLLFLPFFFSCSQNEVFNGEETYEQEGVYNLNITYKGSEYIVPCTLDKNGELVYLDEDFRNLYYNEIAKDSSVVTIINGEDSITYYSSEEEMLHELGYKYVDSLYLDSLCQSTRAPYTEGYAGKMTFWDDSNYKDRNKTILIDYIKYFSHPRLKQFDNFNDKISALKVWSFIPANTTIYGPSGSGDYNKMENLGNPSYPSTGTNKYNSNDLRIVFLGYKDSNYEGSILCCIPENNGVEHAHSKLKRIGWNDKISSIVFRIATKDLYTCDH